MYLQQKITDQQSNPNQVPYPKNPGTEWMDNYILQYDADANNGVFTMPAVVMISMPEMLRFQYTTCPGPDMPKKIADYWKAQVTPGSPQVCSSIVSISNDAQKIQEPIAAYMCGWAINNESNPPYAHLFEFIENQVKSIVWTIEEVGPECKTSYTVSIS